VPVALSEARNCAVRDAIGRLPIMWNRDVAFFPHAFSNMTSRPKIIVK